jgi:hypothetical protein
MNNLPCIVSLPLVLPVAQLGVSWSRRVRSGERSSAATAIEGAMATLGLRHDPATASLI